MGKCQTARTDRGPCFSSAQFREFCKKHGMVHELSSPYNPVSNRSAELQFGQHKIFIYQESGVVQQICSIEG